MKKTVYIALIILVLSLIFSGVATAAEMIYAAATDGEMPMHLLPGEEGKVIMSVPSCGKMQLISSEGPWGLVVFNGKCGWINTSFTRNTYEEAAEATGFSSAKNVKIVSENGSVSLYEIPSDNVATGSRVKYTVPVGTILKISRETASGWALATMRDKYAWVKTQNISVHKTQTQKLAGGEIYYVYVLSGDGTGLRMYSNQGSGVVLNVIPDCVKLTVRDEKNNYAYVSYDGKNGWINLSHTVKSLSDAQLNAGAPVNKEFVVTASESSKIDILSVPESGVAVGSINVGERVFVQRHFQKKWYLINRKGVTGWIPAANTVLYEDTESHDVIINEEKFHGYASTDKNKGVRLYSYFDGGKAIGSLPECSRVQILASKDNFYYVYCDYASGWASIDDIEESYGDALLKGQEKKSARYTVWNDTQLVRIPSESELVENKKLCSVKRGVQFEAMRIVSTGKDEWVLLRHNGKIGWIKLSDAKKNIAIWQFVLVIIAAIAVIVAIALLVTLIIKKRGKKE